MKSVLIERNLGGLSLSTYSYFQCMYYDMSLYISTRWYIENFEYRDKTIIPYIPNKLRTLPVFMIIYSLITLNLSQLSNNIKNIVDQVSKLKFNVMWYPVI